jgi:Flp pilus assembly protein TadD
MLFREAIALSPRHPVLRYNLGRVLEEAGRAREARAAYGEALEIEPGFAAAREALALRLLRDGDAPGALREWGRAERDGDLSPVSRRARGALLAGRGRLDEAIEDLRAAARLQPREPGPLADLAVLYQRRGLGGQAAAEAERVRRLDGAGCVAAAMEGRLFAAAGREREAERAFRDGAGSRPDCPEVHLGLAALLAAAGRRDEAARAAAAAVRAGADPSVLSADPALRMLAPAPLPPGEPGGRR